LKPGCLDAGVLRGTQIASVQDGTVRVDVRELEAVVVVHRRDASEDPQRCSGNENRAIGEQVRDVERDIGELSHVALSSVVVFCYHEYTVTQSARNVQSVSHFFSAAERDARGSNLLSGADGFLASGCVWAVMLNDVELFPRVEATDVCPAREDPCARAVRLFVVGPFVL